MAQFHPEQYWSQQVQEEFDCKEEQSRLLHFINFSGNMGIGRVIDNWSTRDKHWSPVSPESFGEARWKFACGKCWIKNTP